MEHLDFSHIYKPTNMADTERKVQDLQYKVGKESGKKGVIVSRQNLARETTGGASYKLDKLKSRKYIIFYDVKSV